MELVCSSGLLVSHFGCPRTIWKDSLVIKLVRVLSQQQETNQNRHLTCWHVIVPNSHFSAFISLKLLCLFIIWQVKLDLPFPFVHIAKGLLVYYFFFLKREHTFIFLCAPFLIDRHWLYGAYTFIFTSGCYFHFSL